MNFAADDLKQFTASVFLNMGCMQDEARQAADILVRADLRGIETHGMVRLKEYVNLWKKGCINTSAKTKIVHESPSTAVIDGEKGFGLITAPKAMKKAISIAEKMGTGWVGVKNSYHFGIAGYYAMMALEHDMIGIATTNANPLVAPTFSKQALFGTNPLAVAIPAYEEPPFVADFATSPVSRGKLDEFIRQGIYAPTDLLQDNQGRETNDPSILKKGGAIRTLGGIREKGSHKGYCLTALVDIFSAVMPGANFGPLVVPTVDYASGRKAQRDNGIGHFFGAIRTNAFRSSNEFKSDMDLWIQSFRNAQPVDGQKQVLIPGDPERGKEAEHCETGIPLRKSIIDDLCVISQEFGLVLPDAVG